MHTAMPRTARLDTPGLLHHIMIRGIERRKIFTDDKDRGNLIERLSILLPETRTMLCMSVFIQSRPFSAVSISTLRFLQISFKVIVKVLMWTNLIQYK